MNYSKSRSRCVLNHSQMFSSDFWSPVHCGLFMFRFSLTALHGHMGCMLSRVAGCKEWSRVAATSPWVTARVACSGSRLGSDRMAVVVLRRRSELKTTEGKDKKKQITASGNIGDDNNTEEPVVVDSLGLRAGKEQC